MGSSFPIMREFLGTRVNPVSRDELLSIITEAVETNQNITIGHHNLHSLYMLRNSPKMQRFYDHADLVYIDGMSLIACGKLLGIPLHREQRVTFLDAVEVFMQEAIRQRWRLFFLGSQPGVAERAAAKLASLYPGLTCQTSPGYFDETVGSPDNEELIGRIHSFQPHIVLVGMGMPRQEAWVVDHAELLNANVTIVLGGILDYLSGDIPVPPRMLGRLGLEWFFRLLTEPRRLWKRYLVEPWFLVLLFVRELFGRFRKA